MGTLNADSMLNYPDFVLMNKPLWWVVKWVEELAERGDKGLWFCRQRVLNSRYTASREMIIVVSILILEERHDFIILLSIIWCMSTWNTGMRIPLIQLVWTGRDFGRCLGHVVPVLIACCSACEDVEYSQGSTEIREWDRPSTCPSVSSWSARCHDER